MRTDLAISGQRGTGLVDVLDRVLEKRLLIAGDIRISLAEVELLTIRIRLIVCSIDEAQEIGLDWWKYDRNLALGPRTQSLETEALRRQVRILERRIAALTARRVPAGRRPSPSGALPLPPLEDEGCRSSGPRAGPASSTSSTESWTRAS